MVLQVRTVAVLCLSAIVFSVSCRREPAGKQKTEEAVPVKALALFNRGAALLEQYRYSEAAKTFEQVLALAPDWTAARFNLGVACLNLQEKAGAEKQLARARAAFEAVLKKEPGHLHARFCLGLLLQHLGDNKGACQCFAAVYEKDPEDPYVGYKYAETLISLGRDKEAEEVLSRVVADDPGFVSGLYRLARIYLRTKRREKALPLFKRFRELSKLELAGGSFLVQKQYGAVGKYYLALGADNLPLKPPETPQVRILFSPQVRKLPVKLKRWNSKAGKVGQHGFCAGDVDGDGDLDVCLAGVGENAQCVILANDGEGGFVQAFAAGRRVAGCVLGDIDNDGDEDLVLGCEGVDTIMLNDGKGAFAKGIDLPGAESFTCSLALCDVDSDGDLDSLCFRLKAGSLPLEGAEAAPTVLFCNNRNGTWSDMTKEAASFKAAAGALFDDFDDDRDLDALLVPADGGSVRIVANDRAWRFRTLPGPSIGLDVKGVLGATTGDPDRDGDRDIVLLTGDKLLLYRNVGRMHFSLDKDFAASWSRCGGTGAQFCDIDNDGDLDLVVPDARRTEGGTGPLLLLNLWPEQRFVDAASVDRGILLQALAFEKGTTLCAADFTGDGRVDLLFVPPEGSPVLLQNATAGGHWFAVDLRGRRGKDQKTRSNNSAVGARVEVKTGAVIEQHVVGIPSSLTSIPPYRLHFGLGGNKEVQWLRILWPDGVLQAELELAADRIAPITEVQRKTSSCPLLFAWDGEKFAFVCDFGGVGGLGYLLEPGLYAQPDSTEYLLLPQLAPKAGRYVVQIVAQLEEVVYLDEVKLIAVDHPEGTLIYPNEYMAVRLPSPDFKIFCFTECIDPVRAVDHRGVDVTREVLHLDRRYAGAAELDPRFIGVAKPHSLTLDFGDRLSSRAAAARLVLCLHGWVEYGYSSTNYAAYQAGVRLQAPTISVLRNGTWHVLFAEAGYPAGINHFMTVELTGKLKPGDRFLRVSSNMELYWDRIFIGVHSASPVKVKEIAAASAHLHFLGYPREYSPDGRHPNLYDYKNLEQPVTWKLMAGRYTRYGEVSELLSKADDCFVIMGHGDEVTVSFPIGAFGKVPQGCRRTFILKTDSYCKDMDLYTAYPDTVEPLPFHGMKNYPYGAGESYPEDEVHRLYRERYNTRVIGGRTY